MGQGFASLGRICRGGRHPHHFSPSVPERAQLVAAGGNQPVLKTKIRRWSEMTAAFNQFLKTLERTERMPLPDLARYQEQLLIRLVRHAGENLPYYRRRLDPLFTADGDVDLSRWNDVPILTREDAIADSAQMRVPQLPAEYGEVGEFHTSGSTGMSLSVATNALVGLATNALFTRMVRWFGLDTSRPLAVLRRFPDEQIPRDAIERGWSLADPGEFSYKLEILTPIELQLEWLARHKAPYLLTFPSGAWELARAVTPEHGRSLGIEMVFLIGETVPEGTAALIRTPGGARRIPLRVSRDRQHRLRMQRRDALPRHCRKCAGRNCRRTRTRCRPRRPRSRRLNRPLQLCNAVHSLRGRRYCGRRNGIVRVRPDAADHQAYRRPHAQRVRVS
jgi:hypothetical protein